MYPIRADGDSDRPALAGCEADPGRAPRRAHEAEHEGAGGVGRADAEREPPGHAASGRRGPQVDGALIGQPSVVVAADRVELEPRLSGRRPERGHRALRDDARHPAGGRSSRSRRRAAGPGTAGPATSSEPSSPTLTRSSRKTSMALAPGSSRTRVTERFQKSCWSDGALRPPQLWRSATCLEARSGRRRTGRPEGTRFFAADVVVTSEGDRPGRCGSGCEAAPG